MPAREFPNATVVRAAMIAALNAVLDRLPLAVQEGVQLAARTSDLRENEAARVALWQSIHGRDCSRDRDVLYTRLAICVLHPSSIAMDAQSSLEYFVYTFREAGLPESAVAEAAILESQFGA